MLEKGAGTRRNVPEATELYLAACDKGIVAACNSLGELYAKGDEVARDETRAVALYKQSCDHGYASGCVNLGAMHMGGKGVPKDPAIAVQLFSYGCAVNDPQGCLNLSIAYGEGRGVRKDTGTSVAFAEPACGAGAVRACIRAGVARVAGDGVAKDTKGGLAQLESVCAEGEPGGCETLAQLYDKGLAPDVPADGIRVLDYTMRACRLGSQRACDLDRVMFRNDIDFVDAEIEWMKRTPDAGPPPRSHRVPVNFGYPSAFRSPDSAEGSRNGRRDAN
jgi:TPR repeat protein